MKFFLVIAVVIAAVWLWRSGRKSKSPVKPPDRSPQSSASTQEMIGCQLCGTHLPVSEAHPGKLGMYCSAEHRHTAEP